MSKRTKSASNRNKMANLIGIPKKSISLNPVYLKLAGQVVLVIALVSQWFFLDKRREQMEEIDNFVINYQISQLASSQLFQEFMMARNIERLIGATGKELLMLVNMASISDSSGETFGRAKEII
jgi:hypothetical protein